MSIEAFYKKIMTCNSQVCAEFAIRNKKDGCIPRGFIWSSTIPCDILVVGKNPGHPLKNEIYNGTNGSQLLKEYLAFRKKVIPTFYTGNDPSSKFARNKRRYLRFFLGIDTKLKTYQDYLFKTEDDNEIFQNIAFTNLCKCSTEKESAKIPTKMIENCFNEIFVRELEIYDPKVILAAGNEVYNFLKDNITKKYPIVKIKHFSYFYPKEKEESVLKDIKRKLLKYIDN